MMKRSDEYDARWDKVGAPLAAQAVPADPSPDSAIPHHQDDAPRRPRRITIGRAGLAVLCILAAALALVAVFLATGLEGS